MNLSENSRYKYFVPVESYILFPVCLGVLFCAFATITREMTNYNLMIFLYITIVEDIQSQAKAYVNDAFSSLPKQTYVNSWLNVPI